MSRHSRWPILIVFALGLLLGIAKSYGAFLRKVEIEGPPLDMQWITAPTYSS